MIPAMRKSGYDTPFAAAVTAAASTVGPIIPPSVPMIIAGTLTGLSVGKMFLAGAVPGLLLGLGMMLTVYILARLRSYPKGQWVGFGELLRSSRGAFWAILMTVIILFGIVGGFFTPTEASVVSALYAFVDRPVRLQGLPAQGPARHRARECDRLGRADPAGRRSPTSSAGS